MRKFVDYKEIKAYLQDVGKNQGLKHLLQNFQERKKCLLNEMNETGGIIDRNFNAYATDMDYALLKNKNKNPNVRDPDLWDTIWASKLPEDFNERERGENKTDICPEKYESYGLFCYRNHPGIFCYPMCTTLSCGTFQVVNVPY